MRDILHNKMAAKVLIKYPGDAASDFCVCRRRGTYHNGKWVARCTHQRQGERSLKRFSLRKLTVLLPPRVWAAPFTCCITLTVEVGRNCSLSTVSRIICARSSRYHKVARCLFSRAHIRKFSRSHGNLLNFTFP